MKHSDFAKLFNTWHDRTKDQPPFTLIQLNAQYNFLKFGQAPFTRPAQIQSNVASPKPETKGNVDYNKSVDDLLRLSTHPAVSLVRAIISSSALQTSSRDAKRR